jgi:preprotein translocase subunit YajC
MSMVTSLLLLAPTVVLLAVWIMQRFQPKRDRDPEPLIEHIDVGDRAEPRFADSGEIAEQ